MVAENKDVRDGGIGHHAFHEGKLVVTFFEIIKVENDIHTVSSETFGPVENSILVNLRGPAIGNEYFGTIPVSALDFSMCFKIAKFRKTPSESYSADEGQEDVRDRVAQRGVVIFEFEQLTPAVQRELGIEVIDLACRR